MPLQVLRVIAVDNCNRKAAGMGVPLLNTGDAQVSVHRVRYFYVWVYQETSLVHL